MTRRLANVIYWACSAVAALLLAAGAFSALFALRAPSAPDPFAQYAPHSDYAASMLLALLAVGIGLAGRTLRYILAGD